MQKKISIIGISGSLRPSSSNAIIVEAIKKLMPEEVEFSIYAGIGDLPHFNDADDIPVNVIAWREQLQEADAMLVCSPEYAFGIPGSLKNALDWTVGSGSLVNKPLALITAATGGQKAHASMLEVFTALSPVIPEGCALLIPFVRSKLNAAGEISDAPTLKAVEKLVQNLVGFATDKIKKIE